jgi:hypothetical protein
VLVDGQARVLVQVRPVPHDDEGLHGRGTSFVVTIRRLQDDFISKNASSVFAERRGEEPV